MSSSVTGSRWCRRGVGHTSFRGPLHPMIEPATMRRTYLAHLRSNRLSIQPKALFAPVLPGYTPFPRVDIRSRLVCLLSGSLVNTRSGGPPCGRIAVLLGHGHGTFRRRTPARHAQKWSRGRIDPMESESYRIAVASVARNFRFPTVQHREIRSVEHAPLRNQIKNKTHQS